jgi:hypothetical protein
MISGKLQFESKRSESHARAPAIAKTCAGKALVEPVIRDVGKTPGTLLAEIGFAACFNQLTHEEIGRMLDQIRDRGRSADLSQEQRDTLDALEISKIDVSSLADTLDFVSEADSASYLVIESSQPFECLGSLPHPAENDSVKDGGTSLSISEIEALIEELRGSIDIDYLAAAQITRRNQEQE